MNISIFTLDKLINALNFKYTKIDLVFSLIVYIVVKRFRLKENLVVENQNLTVNHESQPVEANSVF